MKIKYKKLLNWFCFDKKYTKIFVSLLLLFFLYVLPIILANRFFNDDLGRSLTGATGWNGDGRPATELLMRSLCGGRPISDISPLPLILAISLLSYTLTCYARNYLNEYDISLPYICALFFTICNPFLLANLSYKFDVLSMIIALSITFVPFLLPSELSKSKLFLITFFCSLIAFSTYQAVLGAILSLLLIDIFFCLYHNRPFFKKSIIVFISILFGGLIYKFIVLPRFISQNDWRNEASQFVSGNIQDCIETKLKHVNLFIQKFSVYLSELPIIMKFITGICVIFISIGMAWLMCKRFTDKPLHIKILLSLYSFILPMLILIVCIAPLLTLQSMFTSCRILLSVSILFLYGGISLLLLSRHFPLLTRAIFICFSVYFFTYVFAYGNAAKSQKEYETYLSYSIVHELEIANEGETFNSISIQGETPKSLQLQYLCEKYPQFNEIVPVYINNSSWIGGALLYHSMQNTLPFRELTDLELTKLENMQPLYSNSIYNCYELDDTYVVYFH